MIATFTRMTVEDSKRLLSPEFYPSWVAFSQRQKLRASFVEDRGEGITMELEMNWDGNPSIILDIKTRIGVGLPVQGPVNHMFMLDIM
uniref:Uncharacterized protein n=1 Tax=Lactuca sativa TaxID=4236 RepID=A0A9R1WT45_LACSA|nr:hypothetical protein LSAT_V11C900466140 [Lactuca sativa]